MSQGAVKASAAERKQEHEAKMQRQILDWIEVVRPERGNVLVMRVPDDQFPPLGTRPEDLTDEQRELMETCHKVLMEVIRGLAQDGRPMAGAAIMGESMRLEAQPAPPRPGEPVRSPAGLVLPPGTRI